MNVAVQPLVDVLHQLVGHHEELLELADRKRSSLVENRVDEISAVVNKESKALRAVAEATNVFSIPEGFSRRGPLRQRSCPAW